MDVKRNAINATETGNELELEHHRFMCVLIKERCQRQKQMEEPLLLVRIYLAGDKFVLVRYWK